MPAWVWRDVRKKKFCFFFFAPHVARDGSLEISCLAWLGRARSREGRVVLSVRVDPVLGWHHLHCTGSDG